MIPHPPPRRLHRRVIDVLLFPLALLVVVLEDVVWAAAKAALRRLSAVPPLPAVKRWLGTLSGWAALPFFAIPEALGRIGEFYAFALMYRHRIVAGVAAYVLVRAVATLIVLFIYQSCEPALMRLHWFAWTIGRIKAARDWARARLSPLVSRLRHAIGVSRGHLGIRFRALARLERRRLPWLRGRTPSP